MQNQDRENFGEETNVEGEGGQIMDGELDFVESGQASGVEAGADPPIIVDGGGQPAS
jgi:hypothetical protein